MVAAGGLAGRAHHGTHVQEAQRLRHRQVCRQAGSLGRSRFWLPCNQAGSGGACSAGRPAGKADSAVGSALCCGWSGVSGTACTCSVAGRSGHGCELQTPETVKRSCSLSSLQMRVAACLLDAGMYGQHTLCLRRSAQTHRLLWAQKVEAVPGYLLGEGLTPAVHAVCCQQQQRKQLQCH